MNHSRRPQHGGAEELGGGRWRILVPLPSLSLRATSVYALEADNELVLIDAGWDSSEGLEALDQGLASMGAAVGDVAGVLVTHAHADHLGLAPRVRQQSGAWVGLHALDTALLLDEHQLSLALRRASRWLRSQGVPCVALGRLEAEWRRVLGQYRVAPPDLALEAGPVRLAGRRRLRILHTPGHTPGHVCIAEDSADVIFTGDHVLPETSPNVSAHPRSSDDPVEDHIASLRRLSGRQILPGHGAPFTTLHQRVDDLVAGHERRGADVLASVEGGATTAWEVANTIRWSTPWRELGAAHQRLALGEVQAHLSRWRRRSRIEVSAGHDGVQRWMVTRSSGAASQSSSDPQ